VSRPFLLLRPLARVPLERRDGRRKVIILRMRARRDARKGGDRFVSLAENRPEDREERHDRDLASSMTRSKFAVERERERERERKHLALSSSLRTNGQLPIRKF